MSGTEALSDAGSGRKRPAPNALPSSRTSTVETVFTVTPCPNEEISAVFARLAEELEQKQATVLKLLVFGAVAAWEEGARAIRRIPGGAEWPVTWIEGTGCQGHLLAGLQAFVVTGREVRRVELGGRVVGSTYEDGAARHCLLAGLGPRNPVAARPIQTQETLENLEAALALAGFSVGDVARTWFFNDDLLAWYADFNRVRTAFYAKQAFRARSLPASTGMAGRNPAGAALAVGAWAVQPLAATTRVFEVASPLQCPAPAYGSSFSRAMEIASRGCRRLLVSGTASIALNGRTVWAGNLRNQVAHTMEVVEAILASRGVGFAEVTRAVAYFKPSVETALFDAWLAARGLQAMPVVRVQGDICRDDLLFEIELDAGVCE
jgi:enamine deaminase RidA (YjgF/YER057c/UK114 family)